MSRQVAMQESATAGRARRRWIVAAVGLGSLMSGIDSSVTNTVLPLIARDFQASINTIEWVLMAYLLAMTALLLTFGRLGDIVGHRRVYLIGFGVFVLASMVCGAAPNELLLIGFRAIQGCGAALMASTSVVIITQTFGAHERGKGIGMLVAVTYFGLGVGPALGGLLAGFFSWRAVFYINFPVGVIGIILGLRILPRDTATQRQARFDLLGAAMSVLMLVSLLLGLSHGQEWGWASLKTLGCFCLALAGGLLFVPLELRSREPMLELRLFRGRLFSSAIASATLNYAGVFFSALMLPFYLVQARHFSVEQAGLLLIVTPVIMMVLAPQAGHWSDRIGSRLLSTSGMLLSTAGLVAIALLGPKAGVGQIVLAEAILGVGSGLFSTPNTSTIMGAVGRQRQGTAAGAQALARNFGMVLGIALAGAIFASRLAALGGSAYFFGAFRDTLLAGAIVMFAGALLSSMRGSAAPEEPAERIESAKPAALAGLPVGPD